MHILKLNDIELFTDSVFLFIWNFKLANFDYLVTERPV